MIEYKYVLKKKISGGEGTSVSITANSQEEADAIVKRISGLMDADMSISNFSVTVESSFSADLRIPVIITAGFLIGVVFHETIRTFFPALIDYNYVISTTVGIMSCVGLLGFRKV